LQSDQMSQVKGLLIDTMEAAFCDHSKCLIIWLKLLIFQRFPNKKYLTLLHLSHKKSLWLMLSFAFFIRYKLGYPRLCTGFLLSAVSMSLCFNGSLSLCSSVSPLYISPT
jgi:hypothetical protein